MGHLTRLALLAPLLCGVGFAEPTSAAEAEEAAEAEAPEGWAYELANVLMSPFCPGRLLSDCPSPQATSLIMWIAVQEAAGRPRVEVEEELFERYGETLRSAPRAEGIGIAAYLIPVAGAGVGGTLLALYLRRQTRTRPAATEAAAPAIALDPELERQIDEELAG